MRLPGLHPLPFFGEECLSPEPSPSHFAETFLIRLHYMVSVLPHSEAQKLSSAKQLSVLLFQQKRDVG